MTLKLGDPVWVLSTGRCARVQTILQVIDDVSRQPTGLAYITLDYGRGLSGPCMPDNAMPLDRAPIGDPLYFKPPSCDVARA